MNLYPKKIKPLQATFLPLFFRPIFPSKVLVGMFFLCFVVSLFFNSSKIFAQSSITLEQAEESFVKNNLLLLAQQYNIEMANAQVIQAKIWELPYLSAEFNAFNPERNKITDVGKGGEKIVAIQQLIYLGGKKKSEVEFAKSNVEIAQLEFEQLLRNLRFELHQNFYILYFEQKKITALQTQISSLDTLILAYSTQVEKGNIPLKALTRLQTLSFSFQNDLLEIQKNSNHAQQIISLLTGFSLPILPQETEKRLDIFYTKQILISKDSLFSLALSQNPEYLTYQKIVQSDYLKWQWEKALATPDLNLGAAYDQLGGAFKNQVNITLGIPIPFWNRNKGNIQTAKIQIEQSKTHQEFKAQELKTVLENAYLNWQIQYKQYKSIQTTNKENLNEVYKGILQNFQKGNISLLEFTDFMESYTTNALLINEVKKQLALTAEELNYITNQKLF